MAKNVTTIVLCLLVSVLACYDRGLPLAIDETDSDASEPVLIDAQSLIEQSRDDSGDRPDQIVVIEQSRDDSGTRPDQIVVQVPTESCGNGIVEPGEQCDGESLGPDISCESLGYFAGGELICDSITCTFDISGCLSEPGCGNGIVETGEQCEASRFSGMKCRELEAGFGDGDVTCDPETCRFDLTGCGIKSECGNGIVEGIEQCDGSELNEMTCDDLNYGFSGGTLRCDPETCTYDISDCEFSENCGNGVVDSGEQCDGSDLSGRSCMSLGYSYGTLACSSDCRYDTSECSNDMTNVICTRGGCFPVSSFGI